MLALQVLGTEASVLRYTGEHARTDFVAIVEGEDEIWPASSL